MKQKKPMGIDILGNIAILKFPEKISLAEKKTIAKKVLKQNSSIKTALEKIGKFKGRLRKQETKYVFGEKTKEALYRENGCVFRFNVDLTYFSPRLSNERKEIAKKIKKGEEVLLMFAGVNPYGIVIAKNSKAKKVYSIEVNREANRYSNLNAKLNKIEDKIQIIQGSVKSVGGKLKNIPKKFDVIVMPRPKLTESFLSQAFRVSKKATRIFYYDFCKADEINSVKEKVLQEAKKARKKVKILNIKTAGEIAPYKLRVRVDIKVI